MKLTPSAQLKIARFQIGQLKLQLRASESKARTLAQQLRGGAKR